MPGLSREYVSESVPQVAASPVGKWLDAKQIKALFDRRAAMQKVVDRLVKRNGPAAYVP